MYAERKVIDRVRQFLRRATPTVTPDLVDLAEQYAAVVARVNRRLEDCAAFLAKGLRTEARHVAEDNPPLLDLARILLADELQNWQDACAANGLPEAVPVSPELVEMLACALDGDREGASEMERLLTVHRRVSLLGTTREKMLVLRRIRAMDPNSPFWVEDLAALEVVRCRELAPEVEAAFRAADERRLHELRIELFSRDWLHSPTEKLRSAAVERHRAVRGKRLSREAEEIATAVSDAYAAQDIEGLTGALERWSQKCEDEDFRPRDGLRQQVEEASRWLAEETCRREEAAAREARLAEEEAAFQARLADLTSLLVSAPGANKIQDGLQGISDLGREVPPELVERAGARLAAIEEAARRRARLRFAGIAGGAVVLLAAVAFLSYWLVRRNTRNEWLARIDAAIESHDWARAREILDELESSAPQLAHDPQVAERRSLVEEEIANAKKRKEEFSALLARVERLRPAGFEPTDETWKLLRQANDLAQDDEDRLAHARLKNDVADAERRRQQEFDRRFDAAATAVEKELETLKRIDCSEDPDLFRMTLEGIDPLYQSAAGIEGVSAAQSERLAAIQAEIASARRHLEVVLREQEERRKEIEAVYDTLPDLEAYEAALRAGLARRDLPERTSRGLSTLLERCPIYGLIANCAPIVLADDQRSRELMDGLSPAFGDERFPWRDTYLAVQRDFLWHQQVDDTIAAFRRFEKVRLYHDLYSLRPAAGNRNKKEVYYFFDVPRQSSRMNQLYGFSGPMVDESFSVETATFFNDRPEIDPHLVPHAEYLRGFLERLAGQDHVSFADFAWHEIQTIASRKDMEPVVAMTYVRQLLAPFSNLGDRLLEDFTRLDKEWRPFDAPAAWLSGQPDAKDASRRRRAALDALPDLSRAIALWQFRRDVFRTSLSRRLQCRGQAKAAGESWGVYSATDDCQELWAVRPDPKAGSNAYRFHVVAIKNSEGDMVLRRDAAGGLLEGEPLFAPTDGTRTGRLLGELLKARELPAGVLQEWRDWPEMWPSNGREPETE
ncbi:MAG: hypothetical protein HY720_09620 [Planctomycetes bacterium]|nr:hypothetical protein [Planctomycetota bacterium]